jgi:hypothetical protein
VRNPLTPLLRRLERLERQQRDRPDPDLSIPWHRVLCKPLPPSKDAPEVDPDDTDETEQYWHEAIAAAKREASEPDPVELAILEVSLSREEAITCYWRSEAGRWHRAALETAAAEARTDLDGQLDAVILEVTGMTQEQAETEVRGREAKGRDQEEARLCQAPARPRCGLVELPPNE